MPIREVAIALFDHGVGRTRLGDVVAIREPKNGIGIREGREFLWLLVNVPRAVLDADPSLVVKHRYSINLNQLSIMKSRALDLSDFYQPFFDTSPLTGTHARTHTPLAGAIIEANI